MHSHFRVYIITQNHKTYSHYRVYISRKSRNLNNWYTVNSHMYSHLRITITKITRSLSTDARAFMKTPYSCTTARELTFTPLNSRSFALISYLHCEQAISSEWSCEEVSTGTVYQYPPMALRCCPSASMCSPESKYVVFTSFCGRSLSLPLSISL